MKTCIKCGEDIHPKRLEILPKTTTCVKCSSTNMKAGVTVVKGEGDHTYNETIIMEAEEYQKYFPITESNDLFSDDFLEDSESTTTDEEE